ncbi:hydroxymethylbilane synthase [Granulicatella sp. zg-ZJ]|uniref:hydroxymethylbilane synthase n=1 Tax=Granulicatella sp. zg-ZJ TaxID=2678504 RepID=UPI0013CF49C8|nr:hydroxymethylbilane synthase [Granulicatella sp. zg-ZJ]NEW61828.1 hydroxymethylbilane synthase [Granulicatella sp. zg-ZJ]
MIIKVGTRKSQLALTQTKQVISLLEKANPDVTFELVTYQTTGDKLVHASLQEIGGKGVFVKDIEVGLLNKKIDIAIHSLKDVPSILPNGCVIGAIPKREDVRDCMIFHQPNMTLDTLPQGAKVGTSSLRRQAQLLKLRPDLNIVALRGNIDTRIQKVLDGEYDAIVLAMAGLSRMGWLEKETLSLQPLDTKVFLPAISQGALAIECREEDTHVLDIIQRIHDEKTAQEVTIERDFLKQMDGDCTFPIGAYATVQDNIYTLQTMLATEETMTCVYATVSDEQAHTLAKNAADCLEAQGAFGRKK